MNQYVKVLNNFGGKKVWFVLYDVTKQVAEDIVSFCINLAMLATKLNSPASKVDEALTNQCKGESQAVRKAYFLTYEKAKNLVLHPEQF